MDQTWNKAWILFSDNGRTSNKDDNNPREEEIQSKIFEDIDFCIIINLDSHICENFSTVFVLYYNYVN